MFDITALKMGQRSKVICLVMSCVGLMVLSGCATSQHASVMGTGEEIQDPLEDVNRAVFGFNKVVDDTVVHPTIKGYRHVVPKAMRNRLSDFLGNLKSPVIVANQLLQGDFVGAKNAALRATVNTFAGFGGLFDFAADEGIAPEPEDFGQTLAVWGVGHGPYMVVPLFGPMTTRDGFGFLVDSFADPLRLYLFNIEKTGIYNTKTIAEYVNARDQLMDILLDVRDSSIDYYASTRSIYYQRRNALVNDENPDSETSFVAIPDYE